MYGVSQQCAIRGHYVILQAVTALDSHMRACVKISCFSRSVNTDKLFDFSVLMMLKYFIHLASGFSFKRICSAGLLKYSLHSVLNPMEQTILKFQK
jgi:hypothetical protein